MNRRIVYLSRRFKSKVTCIRQFKRRIGSQRWLGAYSRFELHQKNIRIGSGPKNTTANGSTTGAVAGVVGIEGGVVSEEFNLESSGVDAPDRRPRHDQQYHED